MKRFFQEKEKNIYNVSEQYTASQSEQGKKPRK